jgi:hypothetical protein
MTALAFQMMSVADRLRGAVLRWACASRGLRRIFVDRGRRLAAMQAVAVLSALALALRAPLVSLWLGAAVFGVPHLIAGVRAVAIRRRASAVALGCALLGIGVGIAQIAGAGDDALRAFVLLFAIALGWEAVRGSERRPWLAAALLAVLVPAVLAAVRAPRLTVVVLAHLHGMGSLVYFGINARRRRLPVWPLVVGVVAVTIAGASGLLDAAMTAKLYAPRNAGASIVAEAITAGLAHPTAVVFHRALFLYAFGQSLHFAAWLRLLPDVERESPTPKPFRRALRDLQADFGRLTVPLLAFTVVAIVLLLLEGGRARETYFALSYFHVGLEGAALAQLAFGVRAVSRVRTRRAAHSLTGPDAGVRLDVEATT